MPSEKYHRRGQLKRRATYKAAWGIFADYSNNSTVHGIKYLGENKRHWSERLFWLITFITVFVGCSLLIMKIYVKWQEFPMIIAFAKVATPIWSIPFPAITICPEAKANHKVFNISEVHKKVFGERPPYEVDQENLNRLGVISHICEPDLFVRIMNATTNTSDTIDIVETLKEINLPIDQVISFCEWRTQYEDTENFPPVVTDDGICFTYNMLDSTKIYKEMVHSDLHINVTLDHDKTASWSLETGYQTDEIETHPKRVLESGLKTGITLYLNLNKLNKDSLCRVSVQGFKLLLHTPNEIPRTNKYFYKIPINQDVSIAVKPEVITTSKSLNQYPPNKRQCFFSHERPLKYFKIYTQSNCELECLTNFTRQKCGCVKFSMPRNQNDKVCGYDEISCYNRAERDIHILEFQKSSDSKKSAKCNCLPSCHSITYNAEISQTDFNVTALFSALSVGVVSDNDSDRLSIEMTKLSIFFRENQFIASKRSELYGSADFLANVGGLLGLFMGVSVLSVIEFIYYITIRLMCNLNLRRKEKLKNAGSDEVTNQLAEVHVVKFKDPKNE